MTSSPLNEASSSTSDRAAAVSPFRLDGKVALVTGCGSIAPGWGNGKAIAVLLARQGARVFGVDRNPEAADVTRNLIVDEGYEAEVRACDVTDSAAVKQAVEDCIRRFGRIDILVNNVGQSVPGDPVTMSEADFDQQIAINLKSAFLCCKYVIPHMEKQGGGSIVNIASVAGMRYGGKPQVGYASGKAALMQMSKVTAVTYAPKGIRLNSIAPGVMDTPLVHRLADKYAASDYEGFVKTRNAQVPMGHMGDAWDVAYAALYLASDQSRYVTGSVIVVDGGMSSTTR
ncbi:SDR family NAD(P)-dependent oxidoreductase [Paraburkholderia sp. J41]|uniref:SDR family NAD(P)-dependent oxidoreductase n=1 Tax=Paraburkholderia sp. J41 TaxID=2805433 RepID=UPI002AC345E4|nr:SDR family NAD(P)-dependent oxidoreductase [Paraburkholderia sp. J41]